MADFKKELNPAQYQAVTQADGPSLVLAGAGSGKTRTLVYRVAYLVEQGVKPERILLLTFTNKAAKEMLSRVADVLGSAQQASGLWGGTFHHIANRILRKMAPAVQLQRNFTILDREDSTALVKPIVKEFAGDGSGGKRRLPKPNVFIEVISFAANSQSSIEDALAAKYQDGMDIADIFKSVARRYAEKKRQANSLDFDDLLLFWLRLLQQTSARERLIASWDYILVDEYQDTNVVQDSIVRLLADKHKNILAVGDDAQSIYSFRAAEIDNILEFPKRFPGAKQFKLEENYRSTPEILEVANAVIDRNVDQFKKTLFTGQENFVKPEVIVAEDPAGEAGVIADRIMALEDEGEELSNIAVLFRAAHVSQPLELELNRRRIPYEMRGGLRFFERAHIKDFLGYLRLLANPTDETAWRRVLQLYEGIGDTTAQKIIDHARPHAEWPAIFAMPVRLGTAANSGWERFKKAMQLAYQHREHEPAEIIRAILPHYAEYAKLHYADYKDRLDDLGQLALFAESYEELASFLAETTLQEAYVVRGGAEVAREKGVILSTIHQAKGLEWNAVFVMSLTAATIPHPRALAEEGGLEEERRLFYVAITRARRRLYLTYPLSGARHSLMLYHPSQFLREIDPSLLSGSLEQNDDEGYIDVDSDGERSYLPTIDRL